MSSSRSRSLDAIPLLSEDSDAERYVTPPSSSLTIMEALRGIFSAGKNAKVSGEKKTTKSEATFAAQSDLPSESSSTITPVDLAKDGGSSEVLEGGLERFYAPIESYEGRHRYDPKARWTESEEKALVRKLDFRICSWACLMFFALQLDRGNISQALSDNMLGKFCGMCTTIVLTDADDLNITTNDYNYGQTIFYISFLLAELPSQLISKKIGPDNWIPIQMISWSIVASSQSRITGRGTFYLTRALLGVLEGGFIPDVILYLSYFYKSRELPMRLTAFWMSYGLTYIVGAFLAFGILHLRGHNGMAGWQWLFALEGSLTALVGTMSYFYLPPSPTQTASRFRGKQGWFNEREEVIMVNRILRDDPSKGDMHNRQAVTPLLLWEALKDYDMWPIYVLGLTWTIPQQTTQAYLTLILKSLGFDTFTTNLLTVPANALFVLQMTFWTWLSERFDNRLLIVCCCQLWMLPCVIVLEVLPQDPSANWGRYAALVLLVGFPYVHPILVALTSRNAGTVRTRTVGSALYNMTVQTSNIVASNIYRADDAKYYPRGNKILLGLIAWNVVYILAIKLYYMFRNASREKIWGAMSEDQRREYLSKEQSEGNKRLDFRFAH